MIKVFNFIKWITTVNYMNSIDLLTSFRINEEENKNVATKKSLNRFNLKNMLLYSTSEIRGILLDLFYKLAPYGKEYCTVIVTRS